MTRLHCSPGTNPCLPQVEISTECAISVVKWLKILFYFCISQNDFTRQLLLTHLIKAWPHDVNMAVTKGLFWQTWLDTRLMQSIDSWTYCLPKNVVYSLSIINSVTWFCEMHTNGYITWRLSYQKQVFRTGMGNHTHSLLWDVITYACHRYLLLSTRSPFTPNKVSMKWFIAWDKYTYLKQYFMI